MKARLECLSRRFGLGPLSPRLDALIAQSLAWPADDPRYRSNILFPGALPIEHSFSEEEPEAVRFELQPFDPALQPCERLGATMAVLASFGVRMSSDKAPPPQLFGAFLGFVLRRTGNPTIKLYRDRVGEPLGQGKDGLTRLGAQPLLSSTSFWAGAIAKREYYRLERALDLFELEPLCVELGLTHRLPGLLMPILSLTGGACVFPPGSLALGIRDGTNGAAELKLELLNLPLTPRGWIATELRKLLQPHALPAFAAWSAVSLERPAKGVVSVKAARDRPASLTVYAAQPASAE